MNTFDLQIAVGVVALMITGATMILSTLILYCRDAILKELRKDREEGTK